MPRGWPKPDPRNTDEPANKSSIGDTAAFYEALAHSAPESRRTPYAAPVVLF